MHSTKQLPRAAISLARGPDGKWGNDLGTGDAGIH